jgi:hypothetical protein
LTAVLWFRAFCKLVIPECLYRGSRFSNLEMLDSRSESLREGQFARKLKMSTLK